MPEQRDDRDGRPACEAGAMNGGARPRTIPGGSCHAGDIVSIGTVRVLGHLEGDVRAERIVVAETATIDGVLQARTVHVDGTVNGPIVADRVTLGPTACIKGNISYETVNIAAGASVIGYCLDRTRDAPATAGRDDALVLPFNRVRTARRNPDAPKRTHQIRRGSMRAVWHAYQQGRTTGPLP